jgi:hypothetical protein
MMPIQTIASAKKEGSYHLHDDASQSLNRMADLIKHYPNITGADREELLSFMTQGNPDDIVRVTYRDELKTKVATIRRDHPQLFPRSGRLALLLLLVLVILPGAAISACLLR